MRLPIIPLEALIEVTCKPPVTINPFGKVMDPEKYEAVCASDAVPSNEPVNPPLVTLMLPERMFIEPVLVIDPLDTMLFINPVENLFPVNPNEYTFVVNGEVAVESISNAVVPFTINVWNILVAL